MATAGQGEASKSLESLDGETSHSSEIKEGKKKRFQPFKAVRKFFNRKKSKDESASFISKSTSELSKVQEPGPSAPAALSLSAESIFSQKRKDGHLNEGAQSMQDINKELKRELYNKLKPQSADDEDADQITSRTQYPTPAIVIEDALGSQNQSMSQSSDGSLFGMDSSEDEFFGSWTPKRTANTPEQDVMNLDVISSNTSLNVSAAKHRISVANKARRASSKHRRVSKPTPTLALTKVEEKPKTELQSPSLTDEPSTPVRPLPIQNIEGKTAEKSELKGVRFVEETKEVPVKVPIDTENETAAAEPTQAVVMRKKKEVVDVDPSKRRTVAETNPSETSVGVNGDKNKRASSYESRNWESVGSSSTESTSNADSGNISEFAAAFNKVRRMSSKRRETLESEDSAETLSPTDQKERKASVGDTSKSNSFKYSGSPTARSTTPEMMNHAHRPEASKDEKVSGIKPDDIVKESDSQTTVKPSDIKKENVKQEDQQISKTNVSAVKASFQIKVSANESEASAYKKTTPTQKPKWRSKTLPEQPVSMDKINKDKDSLSPENSDQAHLKRSSSQNVSKPSQTTLAAKTATSGIVRPSASRPEPKKLDVGDPGSADKGEPEWVLMIRKRKQQEKEQETNSGDKGEKEKKESVNLCVKNTSGNIQEKKSTNEKTVKETLISPTKDEDQTSNQPKLSTANEKEVPITSVTKTSSLPPAVSTPQTLIISEKISDPHKTIKKAEEMVLGSNPVSGKIEGKSFLTMEPDSSKCSEASAKRKSRVRDMVKSYQNLQVS